MSITIENWSREAEMMSLSVKISWLLCIGAILEFANGVLEIMRLSLWGTASVAVTKCHKPKSTDIHRFQASILAE